MIRAFAAAGMQGLPAGRQGSTVGVYPDKGRALSLSPDSRKGRFGVKKR